MSFSLSQLVCPQRPKTQFWTLGYDKNGVFYNLQNIWYAHFVRKVISVLLRTPFKLSAINLVCSNIQLPTNVGCVIAICHTPWKRLLVEWSLHHDFGLIIAGEKWNAKSRQIQRQGKTYHDLKSILTHLKQKGRVIIAFDRYSNYNDCKVDFLGECLNLPVLPIRLAKKSAGSYHYRYTCFIKRTYQNYTRPSV